MRAWMVYRRAPRVPSVPFSELHLRSRVRVLSHWGTRDATYRPSRSRDRDRDRERERRPIVRASTVSFVRRRRSISRERLTRLLVAPDELRFVTRVGYPGGVSSGVGAST